MILIWPTGRNLDQVFCFCPYPGDQCDTVIDLGMFPDFISVTRHCNSFSFKRQEQNLLVSCPDIVLMGQRCLTIEKNYSLLASDRRSECACAVCLKMFRILNVIFLGPYARLYFRVNLFFQENNILPSNPQSKCVNKKNRKGSWQVKSFWGLVLARLRASGSF